MNFFTQCSGYIIETSSSETGDYTDVEIVPRTEAFGDGGFGFGTRSIFPRVRG